MKRKQILISILAVLFVFPLMGTFAQQARNSGSIEVITTFDYPGTGNSTLPQKINERGDVVGVFVDASGVTRAFVRFSDGSFSDPIVDPNDTVGFTEGRGINNSGTVNGDYVISDGTIHGFVLSGGTFTDFNIPGALQTTLLSINDPGDFTGDFDDGSGIFQAWFSKGGTITSFSIPGALSTFAYETNNNKKLVVGYYIDAAGILHGYYRDSAGALHFPIDPPGSTATILFGLNNRNWVVGRYADSAGVTHGLFFVPPNNFFTYDFPGSTFTSLNGISSQGNISWSLRRCFRHCPRIPSSRQRHTAYNSGGSGNEGERLPVAGHSTRLCRLRRGEVQCRRAELSHRGACGVGAL